MDPCSPAALPPADGICRCLPVWPKISMENVSVNRVNPVVQVETASISMDKQASDVHAKYPVGSDTILAIPYLPFGLVNVS